MRTYQLLHDWRPKSISDHVDCKLFLGNICSDSASVSMTAYIYDEQHVRCNSRYLAICSSELCIKGCFKVNWLCVLMQCIVYLDLQNLKNTHNWTMKQISIPYTHHKQQQMLQNNYMSMIVMVFCNVLKSYYLDTLYYQMLMLLTCSSLLNFLNWCC